MKASPSIAVAVFGLVFLVAGALGGQPHKFEQGAKIPTYVNKVGPYFNTHETYHYYTLPVCRPEKIISRSLTLGEVLDGDRMAESLYELKFKTDVQSTELCTVTLSANDIHTLRDAIEDLYYFEFVIDDLPARGFIGQLEERVLPHVHKVFLWTHMHFVLDYNGNQIVDVDVKEKLKEVELPDPSTLGPEGFSVTFTYSVEFKENKDIAFSQRGLHGKSFFPKTLEIHWLSIINSTVLVVLLTGFVAIIVARALNKDFAKYAKEDEESELEADVVDDHGWKIVHADVFRFPPYKMLLCSLLGNGAQFLTLASCIILMAVMGLFNVHRHGAMNTAAILIYALTCGVAGFVSNRLYRQMEGQKWEWNIVLTSCVFSVPFFLMWSVYNSVAWYQGSTQALPATTIILLLLIWLCVGFPLTVLGGIIGKNRAGPFDAPCRTKNIAREIPPVPVYRSTPVFMIVGGFLPFSAISVELYYIFATFWGREHYTLYGILLLVFIILIAVTACISVALAYFQLSGEDYRWWWRSLIAAGSTGIFVFFYAVFYFFVRSNMSGSLQTVQFFGYTILACYMFFLMLGTVGFFSAKKFVRYIYKNLKLD